MADEHTPVSALLGLGLVDQAIAKGLEFVGGMISDHLAGDPTVDLVHRLPLCLRVTQDRDLFEHVALHAVHLRARFLEPIDEEEYPCFCTADEVLLAMACTAVVELLEIETDEAPAELVEAVVWRRAEVCADEDVDVLWSRAFDGIESDEELQEELQYAYLSPADWFRPFGYEWVVMPACCADTGAG